MLTKAQARMMTREWLDDPNAKRWSDARIDLAIQLALDDLWTDMLDMQSSLTSQLHTFVTSTLISPGYIDLRLTTMGGQLTQRFYRVQRVTVGGRECHPVDARDVLIENNVAIVGSDAGYYVLGDQLWLFPLSRTDQVELRYSFKPTPFTAMTEGMYIPFPEGSDSAYVLLAAATTMAKGGAEDIGQLMQLARESRERCMAAIRRQYHGATVMYGTDRGSDFGGA